MFELKQVERYKKFKMPKSVVVGPGDDAAIMESFDHKKYQMVFCGDMVIEDIHFSLADSTFEEIGRKAAARTLSDIAAMAAQPIYMGISVAMPIKHRENLKKIEQGVLGILNQFDCALVGGDMSKSDKIYIDTWCIGKVEKNKFVQRNTPEIGDSIFVTGKLGNTYKSKKHTNFMPRIKEALMLKKKFNIHAMMDISDGIALDLYRMTEDYKYGAILHEEKIPISDGADLQSALTQGEDYELLFTAENKFDDKITQCGFYKIGEIISKSGIYIKSGKKIKKLPRRGFSSLSEK